MQLARKQMEANDVKAKVAEDEKIAEKSSEKIKKKREDEKELEEIQDAALGKKKSKSSRYKAPHVVEGENAKEYIKNTEAMQHELYKEHKFVVDGIEQERMDKLEQEREEKAAKDENSPESKHLVDERKKQVDRRTSKSEEQSGSESESEGSESGSDDEQEKDEDEGSTHAQ